MDPAVDPVLAAAEARGLEIGPRLEAHAWFEAWAVGEALVMRIPRTEDARAILDGALARQRDVVSPYLPRFIDLIELAGTSVTLFERPPGGALSALAPAVAHPRLPAIAAALTELHAAFGFHGDLSPAHIFLDGDTVTFTDPLPLSTSLAALGTSGFALPVFARVPGDARDERLFVRDLAALAATFAALHDTSLGFDRAAASLVEAMRAGPYLLEGRVRDLRAAIHAAARDVDDPSIRGWIDDTCDLALDTVAGAAVGRGTARHHLDALVHAPPADTLAGFRAALATIAARAYEQPSLLGFHTAQRARDETQLPQHAAIEELGLGRLYDAGAVHLERLLAIVGELRALFVQAFGEGHAVELAPIAQPPRMWDDSRELHELLVDVAALLDPAWYTPAHVREAGARFARIAKQAPIVRDNYAMATRRYINFVCSPI